MKRALPMTDYSVYLGAIEESLVKYIPQAGGLLEEIPSMFSYTLEGGGKRVRPMLCLMFAKAVGGDWKKALPFGCAVEYIHTYSLVHDDLPCMDDDEIRRGKASAHIKFGEANALLAGDALLTRAFGIIAQCCTEGVVTAQQAVEAVSVLSSLAGVNGMVGGQFIDLAWENRSATADVMFAQDSLKTSALIQSACRMGVIAGGGTQAQADAAMDFGLNLGLAFQIKDDLIEYDEGNTSDEENGKATYITLLGYEGSVKAAREYTEKAISSLGIFAENGEEIKELAKALLTRNH